MFVAFLGANHKQSRYLARAGLLRTVSSFANLLVSFIQEEQAIINIIRLCRVNNPLAVRRNSHTNQTISSPLISTVL